jgi:hypothetical protein
MENKLLKLVAFRVSQRTPALFVYIFISLRGEEIPRGFNREWLTKFILVGLNKLVDEAGVKEPNCREYAIR